MTEHDDHHPDDVQQHLRDDGDTIDMYYGAADSTVCLATASLRELPVRP